MSCSSVFSRGCATRCFDCNPIRNVQYARRTVRCSWHASTCARSVDRQKEMLCCGELSSPCAPLLSISSVCPSFSTAYNGISSAIQMQKERAILCKATLMQCYSGLLFVIAPGRLDSTITHRQCCVLRIAVIVQNKDRHESRQPYQRIPTSRSHSVVSVEVFSLMINKPCGSGSSKVVLSLRVGSVRFLQHPYSHIVFFFKLRDNLSCGVQPGIGVVIRGTSAATFVIHLWISNWRKKITHPIEIAMHACEVMWPPSYSALFLHSEQTQDRHTKQRCVFPSPPWLASLPYPPCEVLVYPFQIYESFS